MKKKKGRPRNFPNIDDPDGTLRLDVMNKTIIRAVRREYSDYFYIYCRINGVSIPIQTNQFVKTIEKFVEYMMGWEDPKEVEEMYSGLHDLPKILGIFINYCKMKKVMKTKNDKRSLFGFYDLLYNYSHQKFNQFLKIPEIRFLLKKMLSVNYIDTLISKHQTMQGKVEGYREWAAIILSNIEHNEMTIDNV